MLDLRPTGVRAVVDSGRLASGHRQQGTQSRDSWIANLTLARDLARATSIRDIVNNGCFAFCEARKDVALGKA